MRKFDDDDWVLLIGTFLAFVILALGCFLYYAKVRW